MLNLSFLMWRQAYVEGWNKTWNPLGQPITQYYSLGDLWYSFEKWSACGTGTRIENPGGEDVIHYFVPKLSAIQIFTTKSLDKLRFLKVSCHINYIWYSIFELLMQV